MGTFELVSQGLAKRLGIDSSEISLDTELATLGVDSLETAELLMELEDKLGAEIEPSRKFKTIQDIVDEINAIIQR